MAKIGEETQQNNQQHKIPAKPIPKIEDLIQDKDMAQKQNELNILLNQSPPNHWLKQHPFIKVEIQNPAGTGKIKVPLSYLPIQRIEWLLTSIFMAWEIEVKEVKQIANAVVVVVRLKYQSPLDGEWMYQDGVGAMDIQTESGATAAEFTKILPAAAVQKAAPGAESYAVKDAAEKIGRLFGKDLARADQIGYDNLANKNFDENKSPLN